MWTLSTKNAGITKDIYYVLDAKQRCQTASKADHGATGNAEKLLPLGDYSVYCITNVDPSGFPYSASMIGADFSAQPLVLNTLTDICLGRQLLSVVASRTNYEVSVSVSHILAKLVVSISSVPEDISAISITLTNVSKTFYLNGYFQNDGSSQTLDFVVSPESNADGTFDWSLDESLIYPCPTDATVTDITIIATDNQGHTSTYPTTSTTICSTGTRTALSTTWRTLKDYLSYGYTENPWITTIQQGTFDM